MSAMPGAVVLAPSTQPSVQHKQPHGLQERLFNVYDELFVLLQQQYIIQDRTRVFDFLRAHSQLLPVLQEGRGAVSYFFGDNTPILLTLVRDPEAGGEYLEAWVQTDLPAQEAVACITELDDIWFSEKLAIVGDYLNFNLG